MLCLRKHRCLITTFQVQPFSRYHGRDIRNSSREWTSLSHAGNDLRRLQPPALDQDQSRAEQSALSLSIWHPHQTQLQSAYLSKALPPPAARRKSKALHLIQRFRPWAACGQIPPVQPGQESQETDSLVRRSCIICNPSSGPRF